MALPREQLLERPSEFPSPGSWEMLPLPGVLVDGRYRLQHLLGQGGSGAVYEAVDEGPLQRRVALKLLLPPGTTSGSAPPTLAAPAREAAQRRFLREIQVAGELEHPNLVTVYDAGVWQGQLFMVQALMSGRDLNHLLASGPLPLEKALALATQLCDAVAALHRASLLHLDIKPGNILLDSVGTLRLGDFGLARMLREGCVYPDAPGVGSPGYMAPEQLLGHRLDVRTDVFSLGCVLYLLLTGQPAFPGRSGEESVARTLTGPPPLPSKWRAELPRELDRVLLVALAPQPEQRYGSVRQLTQDLLHHAHFSQLVSRSTALDLLRPVLPAGALSLILGTGLPLGPEASDSNAAGPTYTEWLVRQLQTAASDYGLEPSPLTISPGLAELMAVLQALSQVQGRAAVTSLLTGLLQDLEPEGWLELVVRLRPRLILTTRLDDNLALALTQAGVPVRRCTLTEPIPDVFPGTVLLVHLLGSIVHPETLTLEADALWSQLTALREGGDAVCSRLATSQLLYVGMDDSFTWLRRLADVLALDRIGSPPHGVLCQSLLPLETLRWCTGRGLAALESPPLAWLETVAQQIMRVDAVATALPLPPRPYKRLDHFRLEDERIFFGRERETQRISSLVLARQMSLLFGASGAGKSSLLQAGVLPLLVRGGFDVLLVRPLEAPEEELAVALQPLLGTLEDEAVPPGSLAEQLALVARQTRLLVVLFDQAEELFVRHAPEVRQSLARLVKQALGASHGRLRWSWCLREDFLPRMAELQSQLPTLFHNSVQLTPLTADQARLAITEPARLLGLEVDHALTEQLILELSGAHIEPPQLQLVCDYLFDHLPPGTHCLTVPLLERLGGVASILSDYLEGQLRTLPRDERADLKQVLGALVSADGIRAPSRLEDVTLRTGIASLRVQALLETLLRLRLLRQIPREDGDWFELTHEYLTREIQAWQDPRAGELRRLRQLLEAGLRHHRLHGFLLPPEQLGLLVGELEHLDPSEEERRLVIQSRQAVRRSRLTRVLRVALTLLGLIVLSLGGRVLMLSRMHFLRLEEETLSARRWDEHEAQPVSLLRLHQGSPTVTMMDSLFGFPRPLESQTLQRSDLSPGKRSALVEGVTLNEGEDVETRLHAFAAPDWPVRRKILSGSWDQAVQMSLDLIETDRVDPELSLRLFPLLAVSGPPNRQLLDAALSHAERTERSRGLVQGTPTTSRGPAIEPYILLLALSPREWWQDRLHAWVQRHETRLLGLHLLAQVGDEADAAAIVSGLVDANTQGDALKALHRTGSCSAVPTLLEPQKQHLCLPDPSPCLELLADCGGPELLPRIESFLEDLLTQPGLSMSSDDLPTMFRMLRRHGHGELGTVARSWIERGLARSFDPLDLPLALGRVAALEDTSAREYLLGALQESRGEARLRAALRLAREGEISAVPHLWKALQSRSDNAAFAALAALGHYQGPALYQRLSALTRRIDEGSGLANAAMRSPHVRAGLAVALEPYETLEVVEYLVSILADPDVAVAADAGAVLLRLVERQAQRTGAAPPASGYDPRGALLELTQAADPLVRLRGLRVLQKVDQQPQVSAFRQALELPTDSLPHYYEAAGGLREALTLSSFDVVRDTLAATDANVQRTAILAAGLPPHNARLLSGEGTPEPDDLSSPAGDTSPPSRHEPGLEKARWLARTLERQQAALSHLSGRAPGGQTEPGLRWVGRLIVEPGTWGMVLQQVLGTTVEEDFVLRRWGRPLEASLRLKRGEQDWALSNLYYGIADQPSSVRQALLAQRPLPELEGYFRYRQVMGLEPPRPLPSDLNWSVE